MLLHIVQILEKKTKLANIYRPDLYIVTHNTVE